MIITYFVLFSTLSILKHESFFSTAHDLGVYDQSVWGYRNLHLTDSVGGTPILAGHVQPILFIMSLFYLIYSSPITLLVIQSFMIALGALPLYLLSMRVLKNRLVSLSISAAYLLYPSIQFANLFDFHPLVLAVPFIFFSFYFLEKRNYKAFMISLFLAGLCKEYIPLIFLPLGIYIFLSHKKKGLGMLIALVGVGWFVINVKLIVPIFSRGHYLSIAANSYFGSSFSEIIRTIITRPIYVAQYLLVLNKLAFLILLLTPVVLGVFAFLAPEFLLLGITEIAIVFLYTPNSLSDIVYHHQVLLVSFIMIATIYGIRRLNKFVKARKLIPKKNIMPGISILLLSTAFFANMSYGPFAILYDLEDFNPYSEYAKTGHEFLSMIPEDVSVAAPNWILPHLSHRKNAYTLKGFIRKGHLFKSGELEYPQYILVDLSEALIDPKRSALKIDSNMLNDLFNNKEYGIAASEGTWILLERGENYEMNLCKILPYLNKENYPYLKINLNDEESLKKC
ncbi:MAG: DUF2079 domain-containing protein [Nanoarchaeota archaeon]|nr:DUF2079 domain-containing protein [Nanoarchaeota archaeon]